MNVKATSRPPGKPERKKMTTYHTAAFSAFKFFLRDYVNNGDVTLEDEKRLSKSPLKIDIMIIKKARDVEIKRGWGKIMRGHNIVEYKSPVDPPLSLSVFDKAVHGYAGIYAEQNDIRLTDMTVTIICYQKPETLFDALEKDFCYKVLRKGGGIYYVKYKGISVEKTLAIQIIVTSELRDSDLELKAIMKALDVALAKKVAARYFTEGHEVPPELDQWIDFMVLKECDTLTEEVNMNRKRQEQKLLKCLEEKGLLVEYGEKIRMEGMQKGLHEVFALLESGYSPAEAKKKLQLA